MLKIKNVTGSNLTICGFTYEPDSIHILTKKEAINWSNDEYAMRCVSNKEIVVFYDDKELTAQAALNFIINGAPAKVVQKLTDEKDELNFFPTGYSFEAMNELTEVFFKIDEDIYIKGGEGFFINAQSGDRISLCIFDKDNVLGYGANLELRKLVNNCVVYPDKVLKLETPFVSKKIPKNLYFKFEYTKKHNEVVSCLINLYLFK